MSMSYNEYVYGYSDNITISKMQTLNQLVNNACDAINLLRDYCVMSGITDQMSIEYMEDRCDTAKAILQNLEWRAEEVEEVQERDTEPNYF